jgi:anthranilate synthase component I
VKPPFDIAGDLDTPVSAFAKLAAFNPRFLLESVEGGERLARYSFIGFGKCLEVRLDQDGLTVGTSKLPRPAHKAALLDALRQALAAAPKPLPEMAGVPLAGGLVGYSSYDVVRWFERLPSRAKSDNPVPDLHYVAPESLLVFDHLTRGIALLHAGTEDERQALRREVIKALRGGLPNHSINESGQPRYSPAVASLTPDDYMAGVKRTQEYIAAGDVYQLVLSARFSGRHAIDPFEAYRALRLINPSPFLICTTAAWATSRWWVRRRRRWSR